MMLHSITEFFRGSFFLLMCMSYEIRCHIEFQPIVILPQVNKKHDL